KIVDCIPESHERRINRSLMIMFSSGKEVPATIPLWVCVSGHAGRAVRVCGSVDSIPPYFQYFNRINK
ncbi:MAG: hypothetical protein M0Q01_13720, partial [Syntrophales bacterium]|nr:hypothetical protein [Syntrophales bacterium]